MNLFSKVAIMITLITGVNGMKPTDNYKDTPILRGAKPTDNYKDTPILRGAKPTDNYKDVQIIRKYI